jgi:hypothetical protein
VRHRAHALLATRLLEAAQVADPELAVQHANAFRPETFDGREPEDIDRRAPAQALEFGDAPGAEQLVNLVRDSFADPGSSSIPPTPDSVSICHKGRSSASTAS